MSFTKKIKENSNLYISFCYRKRVLGNRTLTLLILSADWLVSGAVHWLSVLTDVINVHETSKFKRRHFKLGVKMFYSVLCSGSDCIPLTLKCLGIYDIFIIFKIILDIFLKFSILLNGSGSWGASTNI